MCGIFGCYSYVGKDVDRSLFDKMGDSLYHRGPDDSGGYFEQNLFLGNRRLSILDIEGGHQPFISDDQNVVVVQNGEIFNHVELAAELLKDGYECKTHCDTEVILRLYERDGIDFVHKLNGMFAIAIYDKRVDAVYLIRDRIGEKPLYYLNDNGRFLFASEIKSILKASGQRNVNLLALNQFLAFNFVPPPLTMFDGVEHVMPGHLIKLSRHGFTQECWWDLSKVKAETRSEKDWIEQFNSILDDAVRIRLRADVPFGAFLSGGVDSSSVVGLMSRHLEQPVNTFSIGFDDPKYDESPFAQEAADRFATNHYLKKVEPNLIGLWPMATYHCDQPHGDVSFLPTYKVASLAAEHVKMVLTGDGADELFAGYDKYRNFFSPNLEQISDAEFQLKYMENISLFGIEERRNLLSEDIVARIGDLDTFNTLKPLYDKSNDMDRINQALYVDMMHLLPGNNLVKPDRMGMAVSLENRAPFLDYRMMELAFAMPGDLKLHNGDTKYIYKKAVTPLIGERLAYRKKQMFTVPIGEWFKNKLADFVKNFLLNDRTIGRGIFNKESVEKLINTHISGQQNNTREIRALIALEIWFRIFIDQSEIDLIVHEMGLG